MHSINEGPKISVIMPVFNAEKYLNRSLSSILDQSYKNFELIIVNDGSTDNSEIICKKYAKHDSRIIYFYKKNEGASIARNFGIENAKGYWISFIDCDDEFRPSYLQNMIEHSRDSDLIIQGMTIIKNGKKNIAGITQNNTFKNIDCVKALYKNNNVFGICGPCCKLFKLSILKNSNIKFSERITCAEDYGFLLDYLLHCTSISTVNKHDYLYYSNPGSLSSKLHSFEKEFSSLNELDSKFNNLLKKHSSPSVIEQRNYFIGYYTSRVVYSIYTERTLSRRERLKKIKMIPNRLIMDWYNSISSKSYFINLSRWLISKKKYILFDLITHRAYRH